MRPTTEELHDESKFRLIQSFHVDDTMKFLMGQLNANDTDKKTNKWIGRFFGALIILSLGYLGYEFGKILATKGGDSSLKSISQLLYGFLIMMFVVLPIHELIHGLTFKYFKAPKVGYGVSLKAGMVYAYAQKFPISMSELKVLAMMPFLILTSIFLILLVLMPQYQVVIVSILVLHTLACIGDFALTRYAFINQNRAIYSYDDLENEKKTYFFEALK